MDVISADYIVVGAGLTGATIARSLFDSGREVIVIDERGIVGGNVSDAIHFSGIRYNLYGPHYFRTSSDDLWEYAQRFGEFLPFEAILKTMVDGGIYDWPITRELFDKYDFKPMETQNDFESVCLSRFPREIYDKFIKGYTEKQWGMLAKELDKSLARRIEIREGADRRLSTKRHQGIPKNGYTIWIQSMLNGIPVMPNTEYNSGVAIAKKHLIYTGSIDSFFGFDLGVLQYRGQRREHFYCPISDLLPTCQLNFPSPILDFIRLIEWKHIWPNESDGTLITAEFPADGVYEYPVPTQDNDVLYRKYRQRADAIDDVTICGRLGDYKYYDMDVAISRARLIARRIIND